MAHTKAGGTVKNLRDSPGQRMGVKLYAGQIAQPGNILIRQRGMEVYPGTNVSVASNHTLFATSTGKVEFYRRHKKKFNGRWVSTKFVRIVTPEMEQKATAIAAAPSKSAKKTASPKPAATTSDSSEKKESSAASKNSTTNATDTKKTAAPDSKTAKSTTTDTTNKKSPAKPNTAKKTTSSAKK